jgi:1-acyl-sn-glycerol-3-phosphate acyltransferase
MRHFDFIAISTGQLNGLRDALDRARRVLAEGRGLLVFPEGTRAPSGRLQSFHPLAFQLARDAGVPIVPVVVHSDLPFMGRIPGSYFPPARNAFRVRFLDPEPTRPEDDPRELGDRIRRRMAAELKTLDTGTYWETAPGRREAVQPRSDTNRF